jgi:rubrerythrin
MNKSFDEIKGKFPELFKELNSETGNFFKEFQTYEEKFGNIIGDVATKFTTEILPLIKKAVEDIKTIEKDYSGVKFNPNKDYQAELNSMNKAGIFAGDPYYDQMVTERGAKVASLNPLKKITSDASSAVSTAISQQPKSTRYTKEFYANYKFDPTKDYQAEINKLMANGKTMSDPEVIKWQEARAAKIYANPNLVAQYGNSIPSQFRISGSYSQGINKGLVNKTGMYMLHGSKSKPEWVLTNDQMFNFVQGLANNLSSAPSSSMSGSNDIMLNINVAGNADKNTIDGIRDAGKLILLDLKKELNKSGVYK